jgi:hypothetical protein
VRCTGRINLKPKPSPCSLPPPGPDSHPRPPPPPPPRQDDLFGSVALAPYLEGSAESGQLVDAPLMRAEGQLGGVVSFSWRLVRSSQLIDLMWEPSLMDMAP